MHSSDETENKINARKALAERRARRRANAGVEPLSASKAVPVPEKAESKGDAPVVVAAVLDEREAVSKKPGRKPGRREKSIIKSEKSKNRPGGPKARISRKTKWIGSATGVAVAAVGLALFISIGQPAVAVIMDGEVIGYAEDEAQYNSILERARTSISEESYGADINIDQNKIEVKNTYVTKARALDKVENDELVNALKQNDAVEADAYVIEVNGKPLATLAKRSDANSVLSDIKERYKSDDPKATGDFREEILVKNEASDITEISDVSSAVDYLLTGGKESDKYVVESGDTVWGIANEKGIAVEDIAATNPDIDISNIHLGDELLLAKVEPIVHYESTGEETTVEAIPFETVNQESADIYEGETKVAQEGVNGEKSVTKTVVRVNGEVASAEVISEAIVSEPTQKIVQVGTKKKPVASVPSQKAPSTGGSSTSKDYNVALGNGVVADVQKFIGVPYVYGGSTPSGFDCSGLVQYVYRANGISIPRTAAAISGQGSYVSLDQAQPGDILCWGGKGSSYHVAIYIGGGTYVHAPEPGTSVRYQNLSYGTGPKFAVRF
ncbi:MAG: C40 family peptidase [Clostridiales Family XIII bacterium]|jgi:cell wall-associated NlpC family hydrolase|nr:C40 family peptidase [Clostridiales Family XIII bacterium]